MAPWISVVVASIALIVAVFTLYFNFLRRFTPVLSTGGIILKPESGTIAIIAPISFFNNGMFPGYVHELRLELHSTNFNRRFFPAFFMNYQKYQEAPKEEGKPAPSAYSYIESPFYPIFMGAKQGSSKVIIFLPRENLSVVTLVPGKYQAIFAFWKSLNKNPSIFLKTNYQIKDTMIRSLQVGIPAVPLDEELDKVREQGIPH
jgi:hypothetical protein